MPELPEVETVARGLNCALRGRIVRQIRLNDPKLKHLSLRALSGAEVVGARRVAKRVALEFATSQGTRWLLVHLRMTGVLLFAADGKLPEGKNGKHVRARLLLDVGALLFYDPRRFGTLELVDSLAQAEGASIDPMSRAFTAQRLQELIGVSNQPLKLWLLRQDKLGGLGNIYASEILFAAQLSPNRPAGSCTDAEISALARQTKNVLRKAIRHAGTTFSDFHNVNGEVGRYGRFLRVYGKASQPCPRCSAPIRRQVQGQRSTFWCANCQR